MHIVRYADAPPYEAPGHHLMKMVRLQGREAGPADTVWMGVSTIDPGGGTTSSTSHVEKFYIVLAGKLSISNGSEQTDLVAWDSCRIAPGEARILQNSSNMSAKVLLVMAVPPVKKS